MAISKFLYISAAKHGEMGKPLKRAIDYIINPEKTDTGFLVGANNCTVKHSYEKMIRTKEFFDALDKRQGYHFIISFKPGETDADTAFEIVKTFVERYLNRYEAVYAVHVNTESTHGHIVFNSVSYVDGRKYRYENGDWKKTIQPIVNELCAKYGLSVIDVEKKADRKRFYNEEGFNVKGLGVFAGMIRRDIDAAIYLSNDFEQFIEELEGRGYIVKQGKYLAVLPPGMSKYRRLKSFGPDYTEERIRKRILTETIRDWSLEKKNTAPVLKGNKIVFKRVKKAKLTSLQKRYFARLYRLGRLKKQPYSNAYPHYEDLKKLRLYQEQGLFLIHHDIKDVEDLVKVAAALDKNRKEIAAVMRKLYRRLESFNGLSAEQGYSEEEKNMLISSVQAELEQLKEKNNTVKKENRIAKSFFEEDTGKVHIPEKEQAPEEDKIKNKVKNR